MTKRNAPKNSLAKVELFVTKLEDLKVKVRRLDPNSESLVEIQAQVETFNINDMDTYQEGRKSLQPSMMKQLIDDSDKESDSLICQYLDKLNKLKIEYEREIVMQSALINQ